MVCDLAVASARPGVERRLQTRGIAAAVAVDHKPLPSNAVDYKEHDDVVSVAVAAVAAQQEYW